MDITPEEKKPKSSPSGQIRVSFDEKDFKFDTLQGAISVITLAESFWINQWLFKEFLRQPDDNELQPKNKYMN